MTVYILASTALRSTACLWGSGWKRGIFAEMFASMFAEMFAHVGVFRWPPFMLA